MFDVRDSDEHRVWHDPSPPTLNVAILWTLTYADVFDYPLTAQEIHRYLVGTESSLSRVQYLLDNGGMPDAVSRTGDYFTLRGREEIVGTRRHRASAAADIWPQAIRFGTAIARLPFVRMVAVTGALSVDNPKVDDDIDYLIVTETGRLWLCRALLIQFVVKPAAQEGLELCPNYIFSKRAFTQFRRNLFTAHEIVQMVPVAGLEIHREFCRRNAWVDRFLPNAYHRSRQVGTKGSAQDGKPPISRIAEAALRSPAGAQLERWEMTRKVRRFEEQNRGHDEVSFSRDLCKGHFGNHGKLVREAFLKRLASIAYQRSPLEL